MPKASHAAVLSEPEKLPPHVYRRKENGGRLSVEVTVPEALREIVGVKRFKHSLKATTLDARKRQEAAIKAGEFLTKIEDAKRKLAERTAAKAALDEKLNTENYLAFLGVNKNSNLHDVLDFIASGWPNETAGGDAFELAVERFQSSSNPAAELLLLDNYIKVESKRLDVARFLRDRLRTPVTPAVTVALDKAMTVSRWLEKYLATEVKKDDTARQYRNAVALYLQNQDDKPIAEITRTDTNAFRDYLHARSDLSYGTCDQRLKKLRAMFSFAAKSDLISKNPFDGLLVNENAKEGHGKPLDRSYTSPEVINITLSEILSTFPNDHSMRWPYLLMFFTGARTEEICGLRVDEIGERWNVNSIHIRPRKEDNRTVKTKEARFTPIHSFLWDDLGFGEFVAARQKGGHTMLFDFPQWKKKYYSLQFQEKMTALRKPIEDARRIDLGDQYLLRHNLINLMREAGTDEQWRCLLVGQSYGSRSQAGYGTKDSTLERVRDELHKIDLRPFDFSKLLTRSPALLQPA